MPEITEKYKQILIRRIIKALNRRHAFTSGEALLAYLKKRYTPDKYPVFFGIIKRMLSNSKDDHYGIFTLILDNSPSPLEFRLKTQNAYGGPKTEDYLARINTKLDAAQIWIDNQTSFSDQEKANKLTTIRVLRGYFTKKIKTDCALLPEVLKKLAKNDQNATAHFQTIHQHAKMHMIALMDLLTKELPSADGIPLSKALYQIEREMMSKKRPERITVRPISLEGTSYYEASLSTPVNADRTASSAKKDEAGIANWLKTKNQIYAASGELLDDSNETYRSASIVPHDMMMHDSFSKRLAIDTARRNLLEHIIPQLVAQQLTQNPSLKSPIKVNFELLTLLSPISEFVDKILDPDKLQFKAMREALNHYHGREIEIMVNGQKRRVQFNGIYHNYGANILRGAKAENIANIKAYNQVVDRSKSKLIKELRNNYPLRELSNLLKAIPNFSAKEEALLQEIQTALSAIYLDIDRNSRALSQAQHAQLMILHSKKINKAQLTPAQEKEYQSLKAIFAQQIENNKPLKKEIKVLQKKLIKVHEALAQRRKSYFSKHLKTFDAVLEKAEKAPDKPAAVDHARTLIEFSKASQAGYDSWLAKEKNQLNYEIQSYIFQLNRFNDTPLLVTCKSGKDRTNAAQEKQKAKHILYLHQGRVPKFNDPLLKKVEDSLFVDGHLFGPGNDICGDNMPPGAQQTGDIQTSLNLSIVKSMAQLQKGMGKRSNTHAFSRTNRNEVQAIIQDFEQNCLKMRANIIPVIPKPAFDRIQHPGKISAVGTKREARAHRPKRKGP